MNKFQWHFNQNLFFFIHENAFQYIVCETAAILSRPQYVNAIVMLNEHCYYELRNDSLSGWLYNEYCIDRSCTNIRFNVWGAMIIFTAIRFFQSRYFVRKIYEIIQSPWNLQIPCYVLGFLQALWYSDLGNKYIRYWHLKDWVRIDPEETAGQTMGRYFSANVPKYANVYTGVHSIDVPAVASFTNMV